MGSLNAQFQKISIPPPPREVICFASPSPSPPQGNSSLTSYFDSKILAFKTPLPGRICDDLPRGGYGCFLEPHISNVVGSRRYSKHQKIPQVMEGGVRPKGHDDWRVRSSISPSPSLMITSSSIMEIIYERFLHVCINLVPSD